MSKESLQEYLKNNVLSSEEIRSLILEIAHGLKYLHAQSNRILHRNLKSANILLNQDGHAKISNFGLASIYNSAIQTIEERSLSFAWQAPEVLSYDTHSPASDIFSFATIIWEMITRKKPFASMTPNQIKNAIEAGQREAIPSDCSPVYKNIIEKCWDAVPNQRMTLNDIISTVEHYVPRPPSPTGEEWRNQGMENEKQSLWVDAYQAYVRAAQKNDTKGRTNAATLLLEGRGTEQDKPEAAKLFAQSAEEGDARAMLAYGLMLAYSDGIPGDKQKAKIWLEKASQDQNGNSAIAAKAKQELQHLSF